MSNHGGSYMLNEILHGLVDIGVLKDLSPEQKRSIRKLLWRVRGKHDCNWGEIIDVDLAVLLSTCTDCACDSEEISAETGCCVKCDRESQQWQTLWGEKYLLQQLLEHRFNSAPRWVSDKLRGASEEDLLRWAERLLDDTLPINEVLGNTGNSGNAACHHA